MQLQSSVVHIQCYGRRSGIYMLNDKHVVASFKNLNPPETLNLEPTPFVPSNISDFRKLNRFISESTELELQERGFFDSNDQTNSWREYVLEKRNAPLVIGNDKGYTLGFSAQNEIESYVDPIKAMHDFARLFLAKDRFNSLTQQLTQRFQKDISALSKRHKKVSAHLKKLDNRVDFKQVGDILMANLYQIPDQATEITLDNFYTNETITISLKKEVSPQKNAERYYQKSKNAHLEVKHAKQQLKSIEAKLNELNEKLATIQAATSIKELQKMDSQSSKSKKQEIQERNLPYRQFESDGFAIWVGKNAKNNDVLLKLAGREDVWLHARGVAGSHVLIRNPEQRDVPEHVLEFAASLAAKYSKGQGDGLVAVIHTNPRYVRKFKGALPGQVKVDREEVVLVEPFSGKS